MKLHFICFAIASLHIPPVRGDSDVFLRRIENNNCILTLKCSIEQVAARSKEKCIFLTTAVNGSGSQYDSSESLCHVSKHNSTFTEVNNYHGHYTKGR